MNLPMARGDSPTFISERRWKSLVSASGTCWAGLVEEAGAPPSTGTTLAEEGGGREVTMEERKEGEMVMAGLVA